MKTGTYDTKEAVSFDWVTQRITQSKIRILSFNVNKAMAPF